VKKIVLSGEAKSTQDIYRATLGRWRKKRVILSVGAIEKVKRYKAD
jgi:hypothetical protein